jgi:hypothetical protein
MSLQLGGGLGHKIFPSESRTNMKWLNVVLDLNGILCVYQEEQLMPSGTTYVVSDLSHSNNVLYLVGKNAVFFCTSCRRFLRELGNVADITIWSPMRVATVKSVCDLLFKDLSIKPVNILGQESCELIRICDTQGKMSFLKVKGTDKPMFLKVIRRHLFFGFNGRYVEDNTVIVDDSLPKHLLNPPQNVILPESWTFASVGQADTYLMDTLLP